MNDWVFKSGKYAGQKYVQIVINACFQVQIVPTILKGAYITPIFKKGDVAVLANYRPISVTPTFAKLFEIFFIQLLEYIEKMRY